MLCTHLNQNSYSSYSILKNITLSPLSCHNNGKNTLNHNNFLHDLEMTFLYLPNTFWPCDVRPYNIYKSASLLFPQKPLALLALFRGPRRRSAEYGRTSPDSTNRQTHNLTRLRGGTAPPPLTRLGSAAVIPAAPRLRLYPFTISVFLCIKPPHVFV